MEYLDLLHWSFFAAALIIAVLTEAIKKFFKAVPIRWTKFIDSRLVSVLLGFALGFIPDVPSPELINSSEVGHILYFGSAGVVSTWLYSLVQSIGRKVQEELPESISNWLKNKFETSKQPKDE